MRIQKFTALVFFYIAIFIAFIVYSYSQVDLNLTLSSNSIYQIFQQQLIQLGYFNRPLSTGIFLFIVTALFVLYFVLLRLMQGNKITRRQLWILIAISSGMLFFAYTAFSFDYFNYLFDARIFVKYGDNPYLHKALDYPFDLWTRFMRWTHRTYPYGPVWLAITIPLYAIGFSKLTLTMGIFKFFFLATHLGNSYFVEKIARKINSKNAIKVTAFYALNPLILIESIASPHLDSLMLFFLLVAIWFFANEKKTKSIALLMLSAGVKFVTGALFPLFFIFKQKNAKKLVTYSLWVFLFALLVPIYLREPFSWYFIPAIGLAALSENRSLKILIVGISMGSLLRYAPFLYYGNYEETTKIVQFWVTIGPLFVATLFAIFKKVKPSKYISY